jgi:hypothetical protein
MLFEATASATVALDDDANVKYGLPKTASRILSDGNLNSYIIKRSR